MAIVTTDLIYNLDTSVLLLSGFEDQQDLVTAYIPDQVNAEGWYGSGGYSMYVAASGQNGKPVIRTQTGYVAFKDLDSLLPYTELTVIIAAKRTGPPWENTYMGIFSAIYNYGKSGATLLAVTDDANTREFTGWGTYGTKTSTRSTSAMDIDTPVVVAMTLTPSTSGVFYTNGVETGTFENSKAQGYYGLGGLEASNGQFVGDIYQVLIYGRSLSASEVSESSQALIDSWFVT